MKPGKQDCRKVNDKDYEVNFGKTLHIFSPLSI